MQWKMLITKVDNIIKISDLSVAIFGDVMTQYKKKWYQQLCHRNLKFDKQHGQFWPKVICFQILRAQVKPCFDHMITIWNQEDV